MKYVLKERTLLLIKRDIFQSLMYEFLANNKSKHTARAYKNDLKHFFLYLGSLEDIKSFSDVKINHLLFYRDQLMNDYSPNTINRKFASISKFFNFLILKEVIDKNPINLIERPHQNVVSPTNDLTLEEIELLFEKVYEVGNKLHILIINILLVTGLRRQEICDLRFRDIKNSDDGYFLEVIGKRGKKITKLLTPEVFELIQVAKGQYKDVKSSDYILKGKGKSKKLSTNTIYTTVEKYAKMAGISKKITPHSLRSTYVTQSLISNVPIEIVSKDMAHSTIETTMLYYKKIHTLKDSPVHSLNYLKKK